MSRTLTDSVMTYSSLLVELRDGVAVITINRPDKLNALNDAVIEIGRASCRERV